MADSLKIRVEFGGGTELLFDKQKSLEIELPPKEDKNWTVGDLIKYLSENYVKERKELFCVNEKIRPGILILVNEEDYEIHGGEKCTLRSNDVVLFISTLHGG